MAKLTQTRRQLVDGELVDIEYEEKTRTKVTQESIVFEAIRLFLSSALSLSTSQPTQAQIDEWSNNLAVELKQSGLVN